MEEQGELIPAEELPDGFTLPDDPGGTSTGERIFKQAPEKYQAVLVAMGEGFGLRQTARLTGLHPSTVAAIRDREGESISTQKKKIASNLRRFVQMASERLLEEGHEIPLDKLAIPMGIAAEKSELLEGRPTSIIDHRDSRRIGDLGSIIDAIEVEELQPGSAMGLRAGGERQKGLPDGSVAPAEPVTPADPAD